jgi:hypothetical protein
MLKAGKRVKKTVVVESVKYFIFNIKDRVIIK